MKTPSIPAASTGSTQVTAETSRRDFLKHSGKAALGGVALPFAFDLAGIGEAAAATASDYKALVCVFLSGGNDYANTVVTYDDDSHAKYYAIRGESGFTKAALVPTLLTPASPLPDDRQYALHPAMTGMATLFNTGKAAVLLNVGPLVMPMTRAQYSTGARPAPPKLMSHNDQQSIWQSSAPEGSRVGWGGRIADELITSNGNPVFTCISAAGNAVFLSGREAAQYQVNTSGAVPIQPIKTAPYNLSAVKAALATLIQQPRTHQLENEYNRVTKRAIATETLVAAAIGPSSVVHTVFPTNNALGDQLKIVARLINARGSLGPASRQVFFVSLGGFDLHDNMAAQQPVLLGRVSAALEAFYAATVEIGLADQVTTFTASDFGRTLAINGNGSDHGWGSHHFILGGAVKGQCFYGTAPPVSVTNTAAAEDQWHIGQGRLLPSTSVDQYAATLARWFGVPQDQLTTVLPNLANFGTEAGRPDYPRDLGFMQSPPPPPP
ncbi:DUF1501 domain-containing protein [Xylophilus sp. GOD-11R]|uniref:DUF1501 domain-containing protein n=1 Tax=Xylophilus sp. GOD-11R TaxID=3089814 RepID=UPI00298D3404|nr:DUF1501 domain-containing protein [Xylophilus sp. GOD-11R]WPB56926.1 DUF1501 domain-containing protein [Xylophilus sp. GOD-11R]